MYYPKSRGHIDNDSLYRLQFYLYWTLKMFQYIVSACSCEQSTKNLYVMASLGRLLSVTAM